MNPAYRFIAVLQIVLVLVLILLTLLIFFPLQKQLSDQVINLKNELLSILEDSLGNNISFSSIHPSVFSYIEIRNLRLYDDEDNTLLTIDRLIFRYDIRDVLEGNPLSAPRLVELRGGTLYLDSSNLGQNNDSPSMELGRFFDSLSRELSLQLRNYRVEYIDRENNFIVQSLISRGEIAYNGQNLDISLNNISQYSQIHSDPTAAVQEASGNSELKGQVVLGSHDSLADLLKTSSFQFYLSTGNIESNFFSLSPLNFYLALDNQNFVLRSLEGKQAFTLEYRYSTQDSVSKLSFNAAEWTPSSIVEIHSDDPVYNRLLSSVISSGITVNLNSDFFPETADGWLQMTGWMPVVDSVSELNSRFTLENNLFTVEKLDVSSRAGDAVSLTGAYNLSSKSANLNGNLRNASIGMIPKFSTDIDLGYNGDSAQVELRNSSIEGLPIADSSLRVNFKEQGVNAFLQTGFASRQGGVRLELESRGADLLAPDGISAHLTADSLRVNDIIQAYAGLSGTNIDVSALPPDIVKALLSGDVNVDIQKPFSKPSVLVQTRDLTIGPQDGAGPFVSLSLNYKDGVVRIPGLEMDYLDQKVSVRMVGNLSNRNRYSFNFENVINGFPYNFDLEYQPGNQELQLKGGYNSTAGVRIRDQRAKFRYSFTDFPIEKFGPSAVVSSSGSVDIDLLHPMESVFAIRKVDLEQLAFFPLEDSRLGSMKFGLSGQLSRGLQIEILSYSDFISRVAGSGSISINPDSGEMTAEASIGNDLERYDLNAGFSDGIIDATLGVAHFPTRRLGLSEIVGLINGRISIQGNLSSPELDFSAQTADTRLANDSLSVSVDGSLKGSNLNITSASLELSSLAVKAVKADINLQSGIMDSSADLYLADATGRKNLGETLTARLVLPDLPRTLAGPSEGRQLSDYWTGGYGRAVITQVNQDRVAGELWTFDFLERNGSLHIDGGPDYAPKGVSAVMHGDASFSAEFRDPMPVTFNADGFLEGSNIDLNLNSLKMDLSGLMGQGDPNAYFKLLGGEAAGALRITGSIVDPDFYGTLVVKNLTSHVDLIPDDLSADTAFAIFEGKEIYFPQIQVQAGDQGTSGLSGALAMDRWLPDNIVLQIDTADGVLPIKSDFNSVTVDGWAKGTVEVGLSFSRMALWVKGNVEADATGITLSNLNQPQETDNQLKETVVDLDLTTGRGVEFYWPTRNFPILRSSAVTGETIHLHVSDPPTRMALTGDIAMRGGELFWFEQNFYIRQGEIKFNETADSFDPLVSLTAEVRAADADGPVKIYLDIDEDRLSQLTPRFTSTPNKSEPEILAMLGQKTGVAGDGSQIQIKDAVLTGTEILGQAGLFRNIETDIKDRLGLDMFSIRTGLFQNFLEDVIVTPESQYDLNSNSPVSLGRYLKNSTLLLGKYIGNEVFMELMVQLQEKSPANRSANDFIGIEPDLEFSLDWATPFFDLTWTFAPANWQNLYVTDHTLTFTRDFTPGKKKSE